MTHNHKEEDIPSWVIWMGISILVFTVFCFVLMTLGMIYW
jgi:hypothetical protein